jgi:hypothetical protein
MLRQTWYGAMVGLTRRFQVPSTLQLACVGPGGHVVPTRIGRILPQAYADGLNTSET